jgi:S1-C subfamily serine protease
MRRPLAPFLAMALLFSNTVGGAGALAAPPGNTLPPLPGSQAPAAKESSGTASSPSIATDAEQLRRGIVQVEQSGRPVAVGVVLSKDGRVLTSLSGIANVDTPEIRYADGSIVKAKVGHRDKAWDLALLIPLSGKWLDGLMPTDVDPSGVELKAFLPKNGKLTPTNVFYKGRVDARSKEGEPLKSVLDLDLKGAPTVPGAPVLEPNGRVVGVLVRVCKDTGDKPEGKADKAPACAPQVIAAPVYALRSFLMKTPANAVQPAPWLGLGGAPQVDGNVKGVRVVGVAPGSPAEKAGLKAGDAPDTIVAVDGEPVDKPEQLAEVIGKHAIGQTVKLLVYSAGKFREVPVTLRSTP